MQRKNELELLNETLNIETKLLKQKLYQLKAQQNT